MFHFGTKLGIFILILQQPRLVMPCVCLEIGCLCNYLFHKRLKSIFKTHGEYEEMQKPCKQFEAASLILEKGIKGGKMHCGLFPGGICVAARSADKTQERKKKKWLIFNASV